MFDIDKYLNEMEIKDMNVSEEISARIKKRCDEEQKRFRKEREASQRLKKAILIAIPAAAVLLIGVLVGAWFFSSHDLNTVAYYTVDVNPSLCVHVDADGKVTSVVSQNEDAQAILDKLDLKGDNVKDAIREVLAAIKDAGYFDAGQRYVLIGCFAADGTLLQSTMADLQAELEADFGDMIDLLIVSGSLEDMQQADQLKVSAGLLKLAQLADGVDVTDKNVEDVVNCINQGNYFAPELSASVADKINLSWDEMDFEAMGYAGKVRYSIAAGSTEEEAKSGEAPIIKTLAFYTYGEQALSAAITLDPGVTKYFALYAQYGDTVKRSNVVMATMPGEIVTPSPSPIGTDEPAPSETPLAEHTVTGRISGDKVILTWSKETAENFSAYKIVVSKTNENPSYPADTLIKVIENRDTTSFSVYAGFEGLEANVSYYFSVTYLFKDGTTVVANAVRLKVPVKTVEPDEYPSSTIYGSISGEEIVLEWSEIKHDELDGYKVVYSFSDTSPEYGDGHEGCILLTYVEKGGERRVSFNANELGHPGATCYFSITALYNGHTIKRAGNVKAIKMPGTAEHSTTTLSGSYNNTNATVSLSWNKIEDPAFSGYQIIYSFKNESPTPGGENCYNYGDKITTLSRSINPAVLTGFNTNSRCWFAVTAVYSDGAQKTSNVLKLAVHPYVAAINGNLSGNTLNLYWAPITGDATFMTNWFLGYQVWYQFTGYGEVNYTAAGGDGGTKSTNIYIDMTSLTNYAPGRSCKFWIKTHYDGGVYPPSGYKTFTYTPAEHPTTYLSGGLNADNTVLTLNWDAITGDAMFHGYQIMYQVQEAGTCEYGGEITNTSATINVSSIPGWNSGKRCYFWLRIHYSDGVLKESNVTYFYAPGAPEHVATTIRGTQGGATVNLNWDGITGDDTLVEYRVMYQFTGKDTYCYAAISKEITSHNISADMTSLNGYESGLSCKFWIVVRYTEVDKAGNNVSFTYTAPPVG